MSLALAFESSCDETGVALVRGGREVLIAPLYSQVGEHRPYGGVVPEYASRAHLEKFTPLLSEILRTHRLRPGEIDYVAVTVRPGLVGALLVGYQSALAAARYFKAPLIGVHHLEAHLAAVRLSGHEMPYHALGLLLSGGNSAIYRLRAPGVIEVVGVTRDDAAGEALDKGAQALGMGYPGGPLIEKAAYLFSSQNGIKPGEEELTRRQNIFPVIMKDSPQQSVEFSFSGLKTALLTYRQKFAEADVAEISFFYQERIIEHIIRNTRRAVLANKGMPLIAAGGVLANSRLRQALAKLAEELNFALIIPELKYCTDNAAMVAAAAELYFEKQILSPFNAVSSEHGFA